MARVRANVIVAGRNCWTLFDGGSRNTYIVPDLSSVLPTFELEKPEPVSLGGKVHKVTKWCLLTCLVEGLPVRTHARVLEEIGTDEQGKGIEILIGALAMQEWGIRPVPDLPTPVCVQSRTGRPRSDIFYVYVIKCDNNSLYIGQTDDLRRRWEDHCSGKVDWTKRHSPIKIVHYEELGSREEAVKRERYLKTGFGRKWLKQLIEKGQARQAGEERLDMSHYPKEFIEFMAGGLL